MGRILVLPDTLCNQIAAGEVIERPAAVVKELAENSIDAGARRISISLLQGGRKEIRVVDNGSGMSPDDALLAFERHATSKIRSIEDLQAIGSMGFRGEALPSIASVSRLELVTREASEVAGSIVRFEAGVLRDVRETGCPAGTMVTVRDLFFNLPARRKFLRSIETELSHIQEGFLRLAMAHPEIHMQLAHAERTQADFPKAGSTAQRAAQILGVETSARLAPFSFESPALKVHGLAGPPDLQRTSGQFLFVYVNGRPVWDRALQRGVMSAYETLVPRGRYPLVILFVEIPPDLVDVNVHPTKREVRFRSPGEVIETVRETIRGSLRGLKPPPRLVPLAPATPPPMIPAGQRAGRDALSREAPVSSESSFQPGHTQPGSTPSDRCIPLGGQPQAGDRSLLREVSEKSGESGLRPGWTPGEHPSGAIPFDRKPDADRSAPRRPIVPTIGASGFPGDAADGEMALLGGSEPNTRGGTSCENRDPQPGFREGQTLLRPFGTGPAGFNAEPPHGLPFDASFPDASHAPGTAVPSSVQPSPEDFHGDLNSRDMDGDPAPLAAGFDPAPSDGSEALFPAEDMNFDPPVAGGLLFSRLRFIGQIGRSYLLLEAPDGLIMIDQHAAHERILFDRLTASAGKGPGQMLLRSVVIDLFPREADTLRRWLGRLREVGFDIEPFGGGSFIVKSLPAALGGCSPEPLIRDLLQSAHEEESSPRWNLLAGLASSAACHSAVKAGQKLRPEEVRSLLQALDRTPFASTCPHGRPLWVRITLNEIARLFGRT